MPELELTGIWWKVILVFALMLALTGSFVVYQTLPHSQPEEQAALLQEQKQEPPVRLATVVVNVPVVVYEKKTGVIYQNLKQRDFQVYEDRVKQEITNFAPAASALNMSLLLENNRRLREVDRGDYQALMDEVAAAASTFIRRFVQPGDFVAIVAYDLHPEVVTDFTGNKGELWQGVNQIARGFGAFSESNLHDALLFVLRGGRDRSGNEYKGLTEIEGRTAVLLVATGFDTFSRASLADLLKVVERAGVPVYCVGIGNLLYKRLDAWTPGNVSINWLQAFNTLRSVAESSGGQYYAVTFESELPGVMENASALLRNQYSLGYIPSNTRAQGKRRKIEILVDVDGDGHPDNERLVVQYRRSYREPEQNEQWLPQPRSFDWP
jgi:VWFA-related protein